MNTDREPVPGSASAKSWKVIKLPWGAWLFSNLINMVLVLCFAQSFKAQLFSFFPLGFCSVIVFSVCVGKSGWRMCFFLNWVYGGEYEQVGSVKQDYFTCSIKSSSSKKHNWATFMKSPFVTAHFQNIWACRISTLIVKTSLHKKEITAHIHPQQGVSILCTYNSKKWLSHCEMSEWERQRKAMFKWRAKKQISVFAFLIWCPAF